MIKKKFCCGCSACMQICPVQCIEMKADEKGFLYPEIDEKKCIQCGRCSSVCPYNKHENANIETETYIGYATDEIIRRQSSSGGIFSILAGQILDQGGIVFGAAFDEKFFVHHIAINSKDQLWKLRGSKYLQSRIEDTFREVGKYLKEKRMVLFTGTACQIAGLQSYLGRQDDNLYTVDILCHGVPSPKIWSMYLEEKRKEFSDVIKQVEFRNKSNGWKDYCINIEFNENKLYTKVYHKDSFMKMFLSDVCLRPSCYHCPFKSIPRSADISLGDCWSIEKCGSEINDNKGISVILIHSIKGQKLLNSIREELKLKKVNLNDALPLYSSGRTAVIPHLNTKKFWKAVERNADINELEKYTYKSFVQRVMVYIIRKIR